jgi:hypothetical protein
VRIRAGVAALVAALAATGALLAHAAGITLVPDRLGAYSYTHPCPAAATVTAHAARASQVTVTTDPECTGRTAVVTVVGADGTALATGSAVLTGPTSTVPVTEFATSGARVVHVQVDGWTITSAWRTAPSGPVYPTNPDTPTTPGTFMASLTWTLVTNNPVQACFDVDVTTSSTTPVEWSLDVDLTQAPFNGVSPARFVLTGNDGWRYRTVDAGAGLMQITGRAETGTATVVAGQAHKVGVCHWGLPDPVQTPGAYTVTHTRGQWTATRACVDTTVTGNGTSPFYFAWTTQVDMSDAVAHLTGAGNPVSAYTYGPEEWKLTRTGGGPVFTVTSRSPASLHETESFTFTTCAVSYR